jgi:hypothetical protein
MDTPMKCLRDLGACVAREQDRWLRDRPAVIEDARKRFLADDRPHGVAARTPVNRWPLRGTAAVAAVAAVAIARWLSARPPPIAFEIGPSKSDVTTTTPPAPGAVGDWIAAPAHAPLPLRFSDGSVIVLNSGARARVAEVTAHGAHVVVERGTATARVVHRRETHWEVKAGPFEVRVIGTAFEVGWDPVREIFTLSLEQGEVAVRGCALPHERVVTTGETFRVTCKDGRIDSDPSGPEVRMPSPAAESPSAESSPPSRPSAGAPNDGVSAPTVSLRPEPPPGPQWQDLAATGQYEAAVTVAEREGLGALCDGLDAASLMKLGDAARFAGRADAASFALLTLRRRFGGDDRAAVAAFHLGRMAFERSAYAEAYRWFESYLRERPEGPLAREASGRLIEALERSGDHVRARAAAQRYLSAFPGGPHEAFARGTLSR